MKLATPILLLPAALNLGLAACASAPPTPPAPAPAAEPAPPTPPPAPPEPRFPYPWLFHDWGNVMVVSDQLPDAWVAGPPLTETDAGGSIVERPLDLAKLPKSLTSQVGRELEVVALGDIATCRLRITGLVGLSWIDPEGLDDVSSLYTRDADGAEVPLPPEAYSLGLWNLGRKVVAAHYEVLGPPDTQCDRPFLAAPPDELPTLLASAPADAAMTQRALAAVQAHALWGIQEEAYQQSLTLARRNLKALAKAGYDVDLPKRPPAHWDTPRTDAEWTAPEVTTWRDAAGAIRVQQVEVGNDLACGAPRAWFLFDADFTTALAAGVDHAPALVLDLGRDGTLELGRFGYPATWIEPLEPAEGTPAVLRETWPPPATGPMWCAWEQIPPLDVLDAALHPPANPAPAAP